MKTKHNNLHGVAFLYKAAYLKAQAAEAALAEARDRFTAAVPVGQTVLGFRHVRVHNLEPNTDKLKAANLWRLVARMQVSLPALRRVTKDWTQKQLKAVAKIVTHHRVLNVGKGEIK